MTNHQLSLSIIVPVYNEKSRLHFLPLICQYFQKILPHQHEVIFVDDGSTDNTYKLLLGQQKKYQYKIIHYPHNRGKGFAVRQGMLNAVGRHRLFMDLDLSVSPDTWQSCQKHLKYTDILIGVRRLPDSQIAVHQPWLRENMGRVFTWLSKTILQTDISDFTCGFKIFSRQASLEVFSRSRIDRWGFDSEILFIARSLGYRIFQFPVVWKDNPNTRVNLFSDAIKSFTDLLLVRFYSILGAYTRTLT